MSQFILPRRTFLKGMGVSLGLPLLEAMLPTAAHAASIAPRFFAMYFPIGIYGRSYGGRRMGAWRPSTTGALADLTLPPILEPLNNYKNDFSILSGLNLNISQAGYGSHAGAAAEFLTCTEPADWRNKVENVDSVDQIIGHQYAIKYGHKFPTLVTSPNSKSGQDEFAPNIWLPGFGGHISYWNKSHVEKYTNPLLLYDALFGGSTTGPQPSQILRQKKSILDYVMNSSSRLAQKLGGEDRNRMQQFYDSIRDIEQRLIASQSTTTTASVPPRPSSSLHNPGDDRAITNANYPLRVACFIDLILVAMQTGLTGVGNIMLDAEYSTGGNGDGSTRVYSTVPDFVKYNNADVSDEHHNLSHNGTSNQIISVNRYQVTMFSRLLDKMKSISEPTGSLLDNSMVVYGSGICDSNEHTQVDLPILIAGRGGGLTQGKHIWYQQNGLPLSNLYLTMIQKAGLSVSNFADSTGVLSGL